MDDLPNYVYYDLNLKNYSSDIDSKIPLRFTEQRQAPIIKDISQYDLSIVRFHLSTNSLPIYIAEIQPGSNQVDPNKMLHTITMEVRRGDIGSTVYCTGPYHLNWTPQHLDQTVPPAPSENPTRQYLQSVSEYYFCYSYEHLCKIINQTLTNLTDSLPTFDPYFSNIPAPFIIFNPEPDTKFTIIAKQTVFSTDRVFPSPQGDKEIYVKIYFSKSLYNLLSTFYFIKQNPFTQQVYMGKTYNELNMNYQLMLDSFFDTNILQSVSTNVQPLNRYLAITQNCNTIGCINSISSIIFTSDMIPIITNQTNKPTLIFNNSVVYYQKSEQQDNTLNIISDFSPADIIVRSDVTYIPEGDNRYISLIKNKQELRSLDLQIYFQDTFGVLHPVYLLSGGSCSVKLLFKRHDAT